MSRVAFFNLWLVQNFSDPCVGKIESRRLLLDKRELTAAAILNPRIGTRYPRDENAECLDA
jgi:hypothetical protein